MAEETTAQDTEQQVQKADKPTDWQAKYEAMRAHSREWERKAFDYQSGCHCAKTPCGTMRPWRCLITSQDVTAPKPATVRDGIIPSLITSQDVTAPKLSGRS